VTIPAELASRPGLRGAWTCVGSQSFGSRVFRVEGSPTYFVKTTPRTDAGDLRFHPQGEALRLRWLADQGIPVPEVVEVGGNETLAWLVTTAVEGRAAASEWQHEEHHRVLDALAGLARSLHQLPVDACPFDGRLDTTLRWAESATRDGRVDIEDLDEMHRGWTAEALLSKLRATPAPPEDLVVCHGDLCLDNVLVDPHTLRVVAVLDAGRLGVADRWRDLSLLIRSLRDRSAQWSGTDELVETLLRRYGTHLDAEKLAFYQLLDEFF
jgi:aminoglycoside phosphotransferase